MDSSSSEAILNLDDIISPLVFNPLQTAHTDPLFALGEPAADASVGDPLMPTVSPTTSFIVPSVLAPEKKKRRGSTLTAEQEEARRIRNRQHAKKSRDKRKILTTTLQQASAQLREENQRLEEQLAQRLGKERVQQLLANSKSCLQKVLESAIHENVHDFIAALRSPAEVSDDGDGDTTTDEPEQPVTTVG